MKRVKYNSKYFEPMKLVNTWTGEEYEGRFTDRRIDISTIPKGKYAYECRHGDDGDWATPVTIEKDPVLVNHAGTFVTDKPVTFEGWFWYAPVRVADWN